MSHRTAKRQRFYAMRRRWRGPWGKLGFRVMANDPKEQEIADILGRMLPADFMAQRNQDMLDLLVHGTVWRDGAGNRIDPRDVWYDEAATFTQEQWDDLGVSSRHEPQDRPPPALLRPPQG